MLTEEYLFSVLKAERDGKLFPIDFDDVWESYGYTSTLKRVAKSNTMRFIINRSGLTRYGNNDQSFQLETSYVLTENDKLFLSFDSYKFSLARASTERGREYLIYLIRCEKAYRQSLEQLVLSDSAMRLAELESEIAKLKSERDGAIANHIAFTFSLEHLHKVSGIVSHYQVKMAVERDFVEGRDYVLVEGKHFLNESTFYILALSFRSERGTDITQLPETIRIVTRVYFQYHELKKKNKRVAQVEDANQLSLFG